MKKIFGEANRKEIFFSEAYQYMGIINEDPRKILRTIIDQMSSDPTPFVCNPGTDFTRHRKLPFDTMLKLIVAMGGNSISKELLDYFGISAETAGVSAFLQQRSKIKPEAFEHLFHEFTSKATRPLCYKGFRLFADDGSKLGIATNPADSTTHYKEKLDYSGYNHIYINALFDLCSGLFVDAVIQDKTDFNERGAMIQMMTRSTLTNVILLMDRGFEGYNCMAHFQEKDWYYLVRVKDIESATCLVQGLPIPKRGAFDVKLNLKFTRSNTKLTRSQPDAYKILSSASAFDFLDETRREYPMSFRVVRLKITEDTYETLITNLPDDSFDVSELKALYHMRWGIETAFRGLKYEIGMLNLHSKIKQNIIQEVFAALSLFNFCALMSMSVCASMNSDLMYVYKINFAQCVNLCRKYLRPACTASLYELKMCIGKNLTPIRPDRHFIRKFAKNKLSYIRFNYRVA